MNIIPERLGFVKDVNNNFVLRTHSILFLLKDTPSVIADITLWDIWSFTLLYESKASRLLSNMPDDQDNLLNVIRDLSKNPDSSIIGYDVLYTEMQSGIRKYYIDIALKEINND